MTFSTDSRDTTAMLDRVAAGSPAALEQLLSLHRPYLKRVIEMRMEPALRTRVDASDVAQEAQIMITKQHRTIHQTPSDVVSNLDSAEKRSISSEISDDGILVQ